MDRALTLPWLLVATPQLTDPNFKRAVVLIVENGVHGAMGFVINRPTEVPLAELVNMPHLAIPPNLPAWYGGPVERGTGIILHNQTVSADNTVALDPRALDTSVKTAADRSGGDGPPEFAAYDGLALSSSEETLGDLVDYAVRRDRFLKANAGEEDAQAMAHGLYPYRFLVGYAGWGPGQLTEELRQGTWIQTPASHQLLFHTPWQSLWDAALGAVGANPKMIAPSAHPYLN